MSDPVECNGCCAHHPVYTIGQVIPGCYAGRQVRLSSQCYQRKTPQQMLKMQQIVLGSQGQ